MEKLSLLYKKIQALYINLLKFPILKYKINY